MAFLSVPALAESPRSQLPRKASAVDKFPALSLRMEDKRRAERS